MHACPRDVPWQRVVNAAGRLLTDGLGDAPPGFQRALLERKGYVSASGTLDLAAYRWRPSRRARRALPILSAVS